MIVRLNSVFPGQWPELPRVLDGHAPEALADEVVQTSSGCFTIRVDAVLSERVLGLEVRRRNFKLDSAAFFEIFPSSVLIDKSIAAKSEK